MDLLAKRRDMLDDLYSTLEQLPVAVKASLSEDGELHHVAVAAAWIVGGIGVLTLGLLAGRELRGRYKLHRRTPYEYYAHSGDRVAELDYSVGI